MAIAVESTSTSAYDTTNDTSITIPKPSGLVAGNLLVAVIGIFTTTGVSINTKSGWSSAGAGSEADGYISVQYKIADSSDASASDFTFNFSGDADGDTGILYRVSGVSSTLNLDNSDTDDATSSSSFNFPTSITPSYEDSLVILSFIGEFTSASVSNYSTTPSITFTEDFDETGDSFVLASAHGIKSDKTEITSYGADFSSTLDARGVISVFTPQRDDSGTINLLTPTTTLNDGDGSAGTNGTANMSEAGTDTFDVAGTAEQEIWSNQSRSSTTWTNQSK